MLDGDSAGRLARDIGKKVLPYVVVGVVCIGVGGIVGGKGDSESMVDYPSTKVETVTKIEYVDRVETVTVIELPESCGDALELAQDIPELVSPVASTMGEQKDISSMGQLALEGSSFVKLNEVIRDQMGLENSIEGKYSDLANNTLRLEDLLDKCEKEQTK